MHNIVNLTGNEEVCPSGKRTEHVSHEAWFPTKFLAFQSSLVFLFKITSCLWL